MYANSALVGAGVVVLILGAGAGFIFSMPVEPTSSEDAFELGEYYFNADEDPAGPYDLKKAQMYYEMALAASSTAHDSVWYQLGRIDFLQGKHNSAVVKFSRQIEEFSDAVPNVYYMLGLTYGYRGKRQGLDVDLTRAAEAFETYIPYALKAPWPRVDLAWVYFLQGRYEDMKPVLEEGLEYVEPSPWLHNMYGLALLNTGERERAHEHFLRAQELVATVTVEEWGRAYPGNDPAAWPAGLASFRAAIEANVALSAEQE